jgi:hypothetical protein
MTGKAALRQAARDRKVQQKEQQEHATGLQAAAEMEKTRQETPMIFLRSDGVFLSKGQVRKLCPGIVHRTAEGDTGGPAMTHLIGGVPAYSWQAFEQWADASNEVNLAGRFEAVRVFHLDEIDPELRGLLYVQDAGMATGFPRTGINMRELFDAARMACAGGGGTVLDEETLGPWGHRAYAWAKGARTLEDALPLEIGLDYSGPTVLFVRSLRGDEAAMMEYGRAQDRAAVRDLEGLAGRMRARHADLAAQLRDMAADLTAAATEPASPAPDMPAGGETEATPPSVPAPEAGMKEIPFDGGDAA